MEIDLVWTHKWGVGSILFISGRYIALLDCAVLLMMRKYIHITIPLEDTKYGYRGVPNTTF
jgi:hypothetical protein